MKSTMKQDVFRKIISTAAILALIVVMVGAFTRLTDAGLGCPDWPGCYGKMVLPTHEAGLSSAQKSYPSIAIEQSKAWTEMAHRYIAGTLGIFILTIFLVSIRRFLKNRSHPIFLPCVLLGLVIFQALLGMWTVTLKLLPIVVMGHLLGGILIFSSLCCLRVQLSRFQSDSLHAWRYWIFIGAIILFAQIALGGWVSSNYAGIACVGFPACNGIWWPSLELSKAFSLFSPIGANYQGGMLDINARMTIQFVHRLGAVITALYLILLALSVLLKCKQKELRLIAWLIIGLIVVQFVLGILNVTFMLPLGVAVAHNGVAALLFASFLSLLYLSVKRGAYASKS